MIRSHHCLAVSDGPRWSSARQWSPVFVKSRVHPLVSFALLQSPSCRCPPGLAPEHLPWGLSPSSRRQHPESTSRRASHARLRSVPGVSHTLDGFLLRAPCGLVSSRCRVRGSLLRGFPRPSAALARRQAVPSWRPLRSPALSKLNAPARVARLQGFDPTVGPLQSASGLDSPTPDPLSSFHSFRISSEHLGDAFAPPPSMTFAASSSL